jgi:hypothetical protein
LWVGLWVGKSTAPGPCPLPPAVNVGSRLRCKEITRRLEGWLAYPLPAKRTRARDLLRDRQVTRLSLLSIRMVAGYSEALAQKRLVGERGFEPPTPWSRSKEFTL